MKLFGLQISREKGLSPVYQSGGMFGGMWGSVREPFAGAWQRNITAETRQNLLAFSAVYACVSLIADDIAKLRIKLMEQDGDGIWSEVRRDSPFVPILTKPNRYQTRIQFLCRWIVSKLLHGNTYVYKARNDLRGLVTALYVLDPRLVTPLVADDGSVWYQINQDNLNDVETGITVPASEIIHDRCVTLFHPLIGVSPIFACGASATQGIRIQANSETFFANRSMPGGQLTAPGKIENPTAERLKAEFESRFSGSNFGRIFVAGDGLKFEPISMPAVDAQLIEQLKWTVEDVARCFRVPLYKIAAGSGEKFANMAQSNQEYYAQTLQTNIEAIELLLDEGLGLIDVAGKTYGTELDLEGLLRMDPVSRATRNKEAISAGYLKPNEARASENLKPVDGGDTSYLQQQNYSLAALAKRDDSADPFKTNTPAPTPAANDPNIADAQTAAKFAEFMQEVTKGLEHV